MTSKTLFHIELLVKSKLLLRARYPDPPNPDVFKVWTEADIQKDLCRGESAVQAQAQLERESIRPALACILNCEGLNDLLEQCGETAIIRISLEKPS